MPKKYKWIKYALIVLQGVTVLLLLVCLGLLLVGRIASWVNNLFVLMNAAVMITLALYMRWYRKQELRWNSTEYCVNARIVAKRQAPLFNLNASPWPPAGAYTAVFVFENGANREIVVPEAFYFSVLEGQYGILTFRENSTGVWFTHFEPCPPPTR